MTTTLIARDDLGRQRGEATFKRTWRFNDARDCREYGFALVASEGCNFGSLTWFSALPIGQSGVGFASPFIWGMP